MCLTVSRTHPHKYVAGYDILVWKLLLLAINLKQGGFSAYRLTKYSFGELMTSRIGTILNNREIYKGLHSYYYKTPAKRNARRACGTVCPAIIPKGAEFYIGTGGEVVSNKLIVYHPDRKFKRIGKANFAKHKAVSGPRGYY